MTLATLLHGQVVELVGLAAGFLEGVPLAAVPSRLEYMAAHVQQRQPALLREITRTQRLTSEQRDVSAPSLRPCVLTWSLARCIKVPGACPAA